jgi:hypothetical protein
LVIEGSRKCGGQAPISKAGVVPGAFGDRIDPEFAAADSM